MYRWIRDTAPVSVIAELLQISYVVERDAALRAAYERHRLIEAAKNITTQSQLSAGILPRALGDALAAYTDAVAFEATFEEGLGGRTYRDVHEATKVALKNLIHEIARLQ